MGWITSSIFNGRVFCKSGSCQFIKYETLAIELAMNSQKLKNIKLKLANNRLTTPLFDTPLFTKNLEAAYINMYERYHADLEPEHIAIT